MDDRIKTQIRIPAALWAWAADEAARRHVSRNSLIIIALEALRGGTPTPAAPPQRERQAGGDEGMLDF